MKYFYSKLLLMVVIFTALTGCETNEDGIFFSDLTDVKEDYTVIELEIMNLVNNYRQENGLNIPKDVAIAGFDNIPISSFANPALTTVHQNTKLAGEILVDSLLRLITGEEVSHYLMPVDLVVRHSSGA